MKKIQFIIILSIFAIKAESTPQKPDTLIFNNQSFLLYTYILEPYFNIHPVMRPKSEVFSTALWRGYVSTFEIIGNKLFVCNLEILIRNDGPGFPYKMKSVFQDVFPQNKPVCIDWYSGDIRAQCFKHKFLSRKSLIPDDNKYLLLHFEKGVLITHHFIKLLRE
jgi:hypothetical protein